MNADQIKAINQKNEFIQKPKKAKIAFTGIIIKLNKNLIIKTIGSTKRSSSNTNRKILIFFVILFSFLYKDWRTFCPPTLDGKKCLFMYTIITYKSKFFKYKKPP